MTRSIFNGCKVGNLPKICHFLTVLTEKSNKKLQTHSQMLEVRRSSLLSYGDTRLYMFAILSSVCMSLQP